MTAWGGERVARVLGAVDTDPFTVGSVSTDTRTLQPGALFVAIAGERFDGHDYLQEARARGAVAAVVRKNTPAIPGLVLLEVDDTLQALGQLARERRGEVDGPVVAVTGSNGKTSTKEMLACVLATRWTVHATPQNFNNLVGVPLTILTAPETCQALVVEVGASEPGEIARLRQVVNPSIAVVTNVAAAHLEGFANVEGVLEEKASLLEGVEVAVVGLEPPALVDRARRLARRVVTAGVAAGADVRPDGWGLTEEGRGWMVVAGRRVDLPLVGRHQLDNAMLALAVADELGLERSATAAALQRVMLPPGRCEVLRSGRLTIIKDTYNANPSSLDALLDTAGAMRGRRPLVVILGTMLELGETSDRLHAEMAARVMDAGPHLVAVLGEFIAAFEPYARQLGERLVTAGDAEALGRSVAGRLDGEELVLVKGSRGVRMEQAIPFILSDSETPCSTTS